VLAARVRLTGRSRGVDPEQPMRPLLRPQLVNGPFGDPAVWVDVIFERRAFLFDLGDIGALAPRQILRISDVFVTHTHMDHFVGFDRLLRLSLGRDRPVTMFGPPRFIDQLEHKLAAYTWNLVESYASDFTIHARELAPDGALHGATFHCRRKFAREHAPPRPCTDGVLIDEPGFRVRAALLDHQIPCLGFALEEKTHINVWKNRLAEFGLAPGPYLRELKRAALAGAADDAVIVVPAADGGQMPERRLPFGDLRRSVLQFVAGQKVGYVADIADHADNEGRVVELVQGSDLLFIETPFLEADAAAATRKHHLTARGAGRIARRAAVQQVVPFHFSPRYLGREVELRAELQAAFAADAD
jgi:ribonuclease Z